MWIMPPVKSRKYSASLIWTGFCWSMTLLLCCTELCTRHKRASQCFMFLMMQTEWSKTLKIQADTIFCPFDQLSLCPAVTDCALHKPAATFENSVYRSRHLHWCYCCTGACKVYCMKCGHFALNHPTVIQFLLKYNTFQSLGQKVR